MKRCFALLGCCVLLAAVSFPVFGETYNLKLHTLVSSPHPYNDSAEYFKQEIEKKSGGRIKVKIFPGASLGNDPEIITEMKLGVVELMISSTNNAEKQIPEYQVFSLNYLFPDNPSYKKVVAQNGPVFKYFEKVYADRQLGMKLLSLSSGGTRNLSTRKKAVNSLADVKGMKMRIPPSPMMTKTWSAFGTLPVTIAWAEVYAAMQTGVADAFESSIPGYMGGKLYEVSPYLALTMHSIQSSHFSMSELKYNKLPADLQKLVMQVADEAADLGFEKSIEYEESFVKVLQEKHKVTVTRPSSHEFVQVSAPVLDRLATEMKLTEILKLVKASM